MLDRAAKRPARRGPIQHKPGLARGRPGKRRGRRGAGGGARRGSGCPAAARPTASGADQGSLGARQLVQQAVRCGRPAPRHPPGRRDGGHDVRSIAGGGGRLDEPPGMLISVGNHGAGERPSCRLTALRARGPAGRRTHGPVDLRQTVLVTDILIGDHIDLPSRLRCVGPDEAVGSGPRAPSTGALCGPGDASRYRRGYQGYGAHSLCSLQRDMGTSIPPSTCAGPAAEGRISMSKIARGR